MHHCNSLLLNKNIGLSQYENLQKLDSPTSWFSAHSVVITKCEKNLLQSVAGTTKCHRKLSQSVTGITECNKYLKARRNIMIMLPIKNESRCNYTLILKTINPKLIKKLSKMLLKTL